MGLSCWRYKVYDWAKQTFPGRWLFYSGQKYQHFDSIVVSGTVSDCVHNSSDGDCVFDLDILGTTGHLHCELTPCQSPELHALASSLKVGDKVRVSGTRTFDPPHRILWKKFQGGGNEIHPITEIEVLK